ncbi:MAG: phage protein NinX family protein [Variovorax sp.]
MGSSAETLNGAELDAWVARVEGLHEISFEGTGSARKCIARMRGTLRAAAFQPSTDWAVAGPIMERERIGLRDVLAHGEPMFEAMLRHNDVTWFAQGELPLLAAMRVYVRSRFPEG